MSFPSRKELQNKIHTDIIEDDFDRDTTVNVIEKQSTYIWIRCYLRNEKDIEIGEKINMKYLPTGETLPTIFGAYNKQNLNKDFDDEVVEYTNEDDKTCLCLMVNLDFINDTNNGIPYLRSLFKDGRFYNSNNLLIREDEIAFFLDGEGELDYYLMQI